MPDYAPVARAVKILGRLAIWNKVTVEDLYRYFDGRVSRRTLQRDLLKLSDANVPLVEERGKGRELIWSIEPAYLDFIPVNLGLDEFLSIEMLRRAGNLFDGTLIGDDIRGAVDKLKQLVPADVISTVGLIDQEEGYLEVYNIGYVDYSKKGEFLRKFLWAAINKQVCEVVYKKPGDKVAKTFSIHPYSLIHHKGAFYGVVFQPYHKSYIYLLIHRLDKIVVGDDSFTRNEDFSLKEHLKGAFGLWRDEPQEVKIEFAPEVTPTIRERILHPSQQIEELKDGSSILTMNVAANAELVAWILHWGSYAKVLEPESLVGDVRDSLEKSLKNY